MQNTEKYYEQIKDKIINTEVTIRVKDYTKNKVVLENYYEIGRLIVEAQGGEKRARYGDGLIKEFSIRLIKEVGKKYSITLLKYIRQFYILIEKGQPMADQLSWSHYQELLPLKDINAINYYITLCIKNNVSRDALRSKIKNKEYECLSQETKQKLIENKTPEITEMIKDPIVINNPSNIEVISEKILQKLILENIYKFLNQFGNGYMFVGNEYPIKIGDRYYRIDLLLYNIEYESYVVVELKLGKLKHEYIGQIELYMNYIDKHIKKLGHNKTIGIILCHKNNKLIMEYCSNPSVISREYILC